MNKHLTYIVPVLVLILILVIALHFTTIEKLDREAPTIIETVHKPDTVIVQIIPTFLKNTTYIYSNHQKYGNKATITDSNYTPPQKYELKRVTVELKGNIAIVGTDCYITHKILSAEYYKFSNYGDKELAILHTSKGEIRIAKVNDGLSEQYPISIKYGNFLVETPSAFIHTKLPKVYKIMN